MPTSNSTTTYRCIYRSRLYHPHQSTYRAMLYRYGVKVTRIYIEIGLQRDREKRSHRQNWKCNYRVDAFRQKDMERGEVNTCLRSHTVSSFNIPLQNTLLILITPCYCEYTYSAFSVDGANLLYTLSGHAYS